MLLGPRLPRRAGLAKFSIGCDGRLLHPEILPLIAVIVIRQLGGTVAREGCHQRGSGSLLEPGIAAVTVPGAADQRAADGHDGFAKPPVFLLCFPAVGFSRPMLYAYVREKGAERDH